MARAIAEALRQKRIPDEIWDQMVASFRELEEKFPDYAEGFSGSTDAFRGARTILSLIRPAFEAKDAEIKRLKALPVIADYIEVQDARRAAEAKLAQAVEALEPFGKVADAFKPAMPDDERRWPGHIPLPTVGDLRRARSAFAAARGEA